MRDTLIVAGALVLVAVAFFAFRKADPKPEPVAPQMTGDAQHPPVTGADGMPSQMPQLANLPTDYPGLVDAGNHNMDAGDFALAAECYRRALAIDGSSTNVRTDYGACLHGMGLPQRALEEFRKVLIQEPTHTIAIFNSGIVFADMQQKDSARFYWNRYLQMDPQGTAADAAKKLLQDLDGK
jgi:tetratricopeptide (TPR) repeat protein